MTGGAQTKVKKVYMIDAKTGDILTSFESKPVNSSDLIFSEKTEVLFCLLKKLDAPHDIAVSANAREVYVGELASSPANALHKFELSQQKGFRSKIFFSAFIV